MRERERERGRHSMLCNRAFLSFVNKQERSVHTHKVRHQILAWESLLQGHARLVRREVLLYTNTLQNRSWLMFCNNSWTQRLGKEGKVCAEEQNWLGCLTEGFLHVHRAMNTHTFNHILQKHEPCVVPLLPPLPPFPWKWCWCSCKSWKFGQRVLWTGLRFHWRTSTDYVRTQPAHEHSTVHHSLCFENFEF